MLPDIGPPNNNKPGSRRLPKPSDAWPPIASDDLPIDILLPRLHGVKKQSDTEWSACCPAHNDSRPSLSVTETSDFKALVHCHSHNCSVDKITRAVGLKVGHLYPTDYAVFRAVQGGKRKSHAESRSTGAPTVVTNVPNEDVKRLTELAFNCHERAVAGNWLPELAEQLRLPVQALIDFCVGCEVYCMRNKWIFAERDDTGRIVGLIRRDHFSQLKTSAPGGRRGLIYASQPPVAAMSDPHSPLYLPEGHTDTIALHSAGCLAIGRPMAHLSGLAEAWLIRFLEAQPHLLKRRIVITADNDIAGTNGAREAARKLSAKFGLTPIVVNPPAPHKDMRDWIATGTFSPGWPCASKEGVQ